ncbi:KIR protein [Plasmodium coatneyi]|uniref:KIR protein n=1 Tax=Plasmodium coatneyi TaxID=208452 RepID=A0A1B1E216_9APIC|nr:KIR protein [Plasmodium coatneyi]ANQ09072.1 KIR protein [Plasmodium coatneyi]
MDLCLDDLPSGKVYKELRENADSNSCRCTGAIRSELQHFTSMDKYKDRFVRACCYALTMGNTEELSYKKHCGFLYYWIGDIIRKELTEIEHFTFYNAITLVHGALRKLNFKDACTYVYPTISKDIFSNMRIIYDYSQDYKDIETYIERSVNTCLRTYKKYVEGAAGACTAMNGACAARNTLGKEYCTLFQQVCRNNNNSGSGKIPTPSALLAQLEQKLLEQQQQQQNQLQGAGETSGHKAGAEGPDKPKEAVGKYIQRKKRRSKRACQKSEGSNYNLAVTFILLAPRTMFLVKLVLVHKSQQRQRNLKKMKLFPPVVMVSSLVSLLLVDLPQ